MPGRDGNPGDRGSDGQPVSTTTRLDIHAVTMYMYYYRLSTN